jgi:hypothetical protein
MSKTFVDLPVTHLLLPTLLHTYAGWFLARYGQIAQDEPVRALDRVGELEGDVLRRSLPDVLDDEAYVGQVRVIL